MSKVMLKWWLGAALLLCLVPSSFALERGHNNVRHTFGPPPRQQVPEGGSAAIYLLGVGIICVGAMFIRSRAREDSHEETVS
jgi:hypothetical protein